MNIKPKFREQSDFVILNNGSLLINNDITGALLKLNSRILITRGGNSTSVKDVVS